jgi:hypothetical protein
VCACCVELECGLSAFWDKELGAWPGLQVHGVKQRAQRIMNGAEEAGSHGGVDGSRLEMAES